MIKRNSNGSSRRHEAKSNMYGKIYINSRSNRRQEAKINFVN